MAQPLLTNCLFLHLYAIPDQLCRMPCRYQVLRHHDSSPARQRRSWNDRPRPFCSHRLGGDDQPAEDISH